MSKSRSPAVTPKGRWLVVSAWPPELARLRSRLRALPPLLRRRLSMGSVGVGLVESALGAARLIAERGPTAVLLVGTAGVYPGHTREIRAEAAMATELVLLPSLGPDNAVYLPDLVPTRIQCSPALLRLRPSAGLPATAVACPLAITATAAGARAAARRSGCALENLEAFAVARAAHRAGLPFAAILGIANRVGPTGHREWQQNARRAAAAACDAALALLARA